MFAFCSEVNAQADTTKLTKKELKKKKKEQAIKDGKLIITPLAGPAYTPELKFTLGGGGILSWRNSKTNDSLPRSSMPVMLAFSTTGATTLSFRPTTYWNNDKLRINGDYWFKAMPDNYWGIGYENGYNIKQSDSTTEYFRTWYQIRTDVLFKAKPNFYIGAYTDVNYTKGKDETDMIKADENYIGFNDRPFNVGFGPEFIYDSRDVPVNAYKGLYLNFLAAFYDDVWGSDNSYQMYILDYRQYKSVGSRSGQVIAWQMKSRLAFGELPYGEMSQIGTPMDLRGYTWGRYRDKSMFYFLAEYRHKFLKADGTESKSGMVGWIGAGTVFDLERSEAYNNQALWLPNYGIGYRLEVQPRMNVRIDFGIGRETAGFYFNFNEAF
ncbi:hypothetical protein Y10_00740 [Neptunitalea sp. Y10]|uniref:Bacterial surface antigen (D15) domain-containing protein n=2 Tax=Neptunitalea lumnitzerae TaxID=2965509 RepID=A0ABQ5MED1_9FLAO|nr:hypothetical protein Y10_00740 [Neptunitalea sp. Y10]